MKKLYEVDEKGIIKASVCGLFSDQDEPENIPPIYQFPLGGANNFSSPKKDDEVWVMFFDDNPLDLFYIRKEGGSQVTLFYIGYYWLLELVPALEGDVAGGEAAEGVDERFGKASIGEQGDVEVYSGTADLVSVGELTSGEVLREVHYHVNLLAVEHV